MLFKKFPFVRQLDKMDCGAACIKMILSYYGKDQYSIQEIRNKCGITRLGITALGICDAAEEVGLKTFVVDVNFESLSKEVTLPCIIHWKQRHFVVVHRISDKYVWVADPAVGRLRYRKDKFLNGWLYNGKMKKEDNDTGYVILVEPSTITASAHTRQRRKKYDLRMLAGYLYRFRPQVFQIVLTIILSSLLLISFPFFTQILVDRGIRSKNITLIYLILSGLLIFYVSQTLLDLTRRWFILYITREINISLLADFLQKIMRLPISFFYSRMHSDIVQRIEDERQVENFLSTTILSAFFSLINILLFGVILCYYNLGIFMIFLIGCSLYFTWVLLFVKQRVTLSYRRRDEQVENRANILQLINGIAEIKLNNSEKKRRREWESIQAKISITSIKELRIEQLQTVGGSFIIQITYLLITCVAAVSVVKGHITLGMMLSTQYIVGQLTAPINSFVSFIQTTKEAKISMERLGEVFEMKEENYDIAPAGLYKGKDILLENVSFRYGTVNSHPVLKDINLIIPAGKVTAIVGTSGSGKTTLVKILLKFFNASHGRVIVGDTDINHLGENDWRRKCGVVMQDGFIFGDTILRNITESELGERIDRQKLERAVDISNLRELIESLPLKFQTILSVGGMSLSGGENQRVLIARAVYKNPEFLFFDEATSALDARNERVIMQRLGEFFEGKTVVVIAHRLSTVKNADNIVVLEKGQIVEQGTHDQLVKDEGYYYNLIKNQLELGA